MTKSPISSSNNVKLAAVARSWLACRVARVHNNYHARRLFLLEAFFQPVQVWVPGVGLTPVVGINVGLASASAVCTTLMSNACPVLRVGQISHSEVN